MNKKKFYAKRYVLDYYKRNEDDTHWDFFGRVSSDFMPDMSGLYPDIKHCNVDNGFDMVKSYWQTADGSLGVVLRCYGYRK